MHKIISLKPPQLVSLIVLLAFGLILIATTPDVAMVRTMTIFLIVIGVGLTACQRTRVSLRDDRLKILSTFWLLKLFITLVLLYAGWIPYLDPATSPVWGYDPQRYYVDAKGLIDNNWVPVAGLNYLGIIYYYGLIFYIFGHNPVIPALINSLITLLGTLYLIDSAYKFKNRDSTKNWTISYLLLIPEILWYDVMTSRETIVGVLILAATLTVGRYKFNINDNKLFIRSIIVFSSLLLIQAIRSTMLIPTILAILLIIFVKLPSRNINWTKIILLLVFGVPFLIFGSTLFNIYSGANSLNYIDSIGTSFSAKNNIASFEGINWSENSIGKLLMPNNILQAIIYLPIRMFIYLIAPLPKIGFSISGLLSGSWLDWQSLMVVPSSLLNIIAIPYAMAGFSYAWHARHRDPAVLVLHYSFWLTFVTVAGGNIIIHERYRVMMSLLLFSCAWLGYTSCSQKFLLKYIKIRYTVLFSGTIFLIVFKLF